MRNISEEEFQRAIAGMREFKEMQSRFETKAACVSYLVKETGLPERECAEAYDLYAALDLSGASAASPKTKEENRR